MTHEELFHRWIEAVEKDQNWEIEQTRARSAPVANGIPRYSTILPPANEEVLSLTDQLKVQSSSSVNCGTTIDNQMCSSNKRSLITS